SLTAFIVVYFVVFGAGFFYLLRLMRKSPTRYEEGLDSRLPDGTKTDAITHSNHLT
ncbi:cytochrome ubiquinol oxidase subunit I, partial [Vibrio parahaemolyticus]|nr:cytochrome ubiquinol oxidase subunit I [Vibrio parahaemolyticus]